MHHLHLCRCYRYYYIHCQDHVYYHQSHHQNYYHYRRRNQHKSRQLSLLSYLWIQSWVENKQEIARKGESREQIFMYAKAAVWSYHLCQDMFPYRLSTTKRKVMRTNARLSYNLPFGWLAKYNFSTQHP